MTENPQCQEIVYRSGGPFRGSRCSNRAKGKYDGVWKCGVHSPEAVTRREQRMKERDAAWGAKWKRRQERHERSAACTAAFHSPDGRHIPTEQITEGLIFRLYDALKEMLDLADSHNWGELASSEGQAFVDHSALLSSLKVQQERPEYDEPDIGRCKCQECDGKGYVTPVPGYQSACMNCNGTGQVVPK